MSTQTASCLITCAAAAGTLRPSHIVTEQVPCETVDRGDISKKHTQERILVSSCGTGISSSRCAVLRLLPNGSNLMRCWEDVRGRRWSKMCAVSKCVCVAERHCCVFGVTSRAQALVPGEDTPPPGKNRSTTGCLGEETGVPTNWERMGGMWEVAGVRRKTPQITHPVESAVENGARDISQ
jgi:hypothetical protein